MLNELQKFHFAHQEVPEEVENSFERLFGAKKDSMVSAAISAYSRAKHHNGVYVGSSILVLGKDFDLSEPELYTGANKKLDPRMLAWPNRKCAEMQALMSSLNPEYSQEELDTKGEAIEQGELENGGIVAAIVTVSERRNTGELDTMEHDVLYPCKQCQEVYEELLINKRISPKTIIYNARIENGKVAAGKPMTLEALLEKFKNGKEERHQNTIRQLLEANNNALEAYGQELEGVHGQFGSFKDDPVPPIKPGNNYTAIREQQRERVEAILEAKGYCIDTILNAIKSAREEGVSKTRILDNLGLSGIPVDKDVRGFTEPELEKISERYEEVLARKNSI